MEQDDRVNKTTMIAAVIGAVIATVVVLDYAGRIEHNVDKDAFPLADYKVILLEPGATHRMSSKPAEQYAYCDNGFLFIQSQTDINLRGPLVDFKNRGIPCIADSFQAQTTPPEQCSLPWFLRPDSCK